MRLIPLRLALLVTLITAALFTSLAAPSTTSAQQSCGTAPAPRLTAGGQGRVTISDGMGNNLRVSPSAAAGTTILGVLADGEVFNVLGAPTCADNYWWWQVRRWDGQTGWTAEGAGTEYWVEPWPIAGSTYATGARPAIEPRYLAYLSGTDANTVPMLMAADSGQNVTITTTVTQNNALVWSPDGKMVAFSDGRDIYVAAPAVFRNVTNTPDSPDYAPTWSPDSTKIAYVSEASGNPDIAVISADGTNRISLTTDPATDDFPAWSPDGARIAFASDRAGNHDLYTINSADGGNLIQVTSSDSIDIAPVWSPNGSKIAFIGSDTVNSDIFIAQPDGTINKLTLGGKNSSPVWSPDSKRIAYVGENPALSGKFDLFSVDASDVMNAGKFALQYTTSGSEIRGLTWSPDGQWIAFAAKLTGSFDIFAIRSSGINLVNLTNSPTVDDTLPVWQPKQNPFDGFTPLAVTPAAATPAASTINPGTQDLLLIYDAAVPVFTLQNTAGAPLNLTPLSFTGAGVTVPATIWDTEYLSSPLATFKDKGCLMMWRFGLPVQDTPPECATYRQGYVANESVMFWTQTSFQVLYNGTVVATCDVAAKRCVVDLP